MVENKNHQQKHTQVIILSPEKLLQIDPANSRLTQWLLLICTGTLNRQQDSFNGSRDHQKTTLGKT